MFGFNHKMLPSVTSKSLLIFCTLDIFVQGEPGLEGDPGPAGPDGAKVFYKISDATLFYVKWYLKHI